MSKTAMKLIKHINLVAAGKRTAKLFHIFAMRLSFSWCIRHGVQPLWHLSKMCNMFHKSCVENFVSVEEIVAETTAEMTQCRRNGWNQSKKLVGKLHIICHRWRLVSGFQHAIYCIKSVSNNKSTCCLWNQLTGFILVVNLIVVDLKKKI